MRKKMHTFSQLLLGVFPIMTIFVIDRQSFEISNVLFNLLVGSIIVASIFYLLIIIMSQIILKATVFPSTLGLIVYPFFFYALYLPGRDLMAKLFNYPQTPPYTIEVGSKAHTMIFDGGSEWLLACLILFLLINFIVFSCLLYAEKLLEKREFKAK